VKPFIRGPISRRLFIFNILIVFMPVAGFFSLSLYEDRLLADLESSMVQQGRILAAWMQEGPLSEERATEVLASLKQKHTARIRIVDAQGRLLADSAGQPGAGSPAESGKFDTAPDGREGRVEYAAEKLAPIKRKAETTLLYRALSFPVRLARKYFLPPAPPLESADFYSGKATLEGSEISRALSGFYGAITRFSSGGQNSVTLYSAIPIVKNRQVSGAVLVSQSTYRILASLYDFRLATGRIFILSLVAAALISLLLGLTISRPLSRLRKEAESATSGGGERQRAFHLSGRNDEIDRLSASLTRVVNDLHRQIALSERFASDAAHEMRNRISGIRNAAELIAGASASETGESVALILESAGRMDKVIAALRDLSRIEADPAGPRTADAGAVIDSVTSAMGERRPDIKFSLSVQPAGGPDQPAIALPISPEHLEIIAVNLLENAASFSPPRGTVAVTLVRDDSATRLTVRDQGPGIPEEHRSRVFERFFSWRPDDAKENDSDGSRHAPHTGIGLSIVEAVMRRAGGSASCANHPSGGAVFTLVFPAPGAPVGDQ